MHHDALQLSSFLGAGRWSRLTLALTLGAALALTTIAHASEGANETRETQQPAMPDSSGKQTPNTHSPEATKGVLQIRSEPSGALVSVDGKRVGSTPIDFVTSIGRHRVELRRAGYQLHVEDVVVGIESGEPFMAKLEPVPSEAKRKPPSWRLITIGSVLGSGVGLFASGATLVGIHDQAPRRHCRGYAPEVDCPFRYRTNVLGGILAGVGFVNIVTATVFAMYTNQYNRKRSEHHHRPVKIRPTATGITIGF